jgi:hypothetical protein
MNTFSLPFVNVRLTLLNNVPPLDAVNIPASPQVPTASVVPKNDFNVATFVETDELNNAFLSSSVSSAISDAAAVVVPVPTPIYVRLELANPNNLLAINCSPSVVTTFFFSASSFPSTQLPFLSLTA